MDAIAGGSTLADGAAHCPGLSRFSRELLRARLPRSQKLAAKQFGVSPPGI
jgi:hypothetical protein